MNIYKKNGRNKIKDEDGNIYDAMWGGVCMEDDNLRPEDILKMLNSRFEVVI